MLKNKNNLEKKMLGKKIHSNIFYVLHNKDLKNPLYHDFGTFSLTRLSLLKRLNPLLFLPSPSPTHPQNKNLKKTQHEFHTGMAG